MRFRVANAFGRSLLRANIAFGVRWHSRETFESVNAREEIEKSKRDERDGAPLPAKRLGKQSAQATELDSKTKACEESQSQSTWLFSDPAVIRFTIFSFSAAGRIPTGWRAASRAASSAGCFAASARSTASSPRTAAGLSFETSPSQPFQFTSITLYSRTFRSRAQLRVSSTMRCLT